MIRANMLIFAEVIRCLLDCC